MKRNKSVHYIFIIGLVLLLSFVLLSSEVKEASQGQVEFVSTLDQKIHSVLLDIRAPKITAMAIDITALGSATVLTLIVILAISIFIGYERNADALTLILVSLGAAFITSILKNYYSIPRPDEIVQLVNVSGYSYPSGHTLASTSIYFTLAYLIKAHLSQRVSRLAIVIIFILVILLIGISRLYLGVHNFTDVLAGIFIGISWALLVNGLRWFLKTRRYLNDL